MRGTPPAPIEHESMVHNIKAVSRRVKSQIASMRLPLLAAFAVALSLLSVPANVTSLKAQLNQPALNVPTIKHLVGRTAVVRKSNNLSSNASMRNSTSLSVTQTNSSQAAGQTSTLQNVVINGEKVPVPANGSLSKTFTDATSKSVVNISTSETSISSNSSTSLLTVQMSSSSSTSGNPT